MVKKHEVSINIINIIDKITHLSDLVKKSKEQHISNVAAYKSFLREHCGVLGKVPYCFIHQSICDLFDIDRIIDDMDIQLTDIETVLSELTLIDLLSMLSMIKKLMEFDSLMEDMEEHEIGFMIGEFEKYLLT